MVCRRSASVVVPLLVALAAGCGSSPEKHTANKPVVEPAAEPAAEPPASEQDESVAARRSIHDALASRLETLEMQLSGLRERVAALPEKLRDEWHDTVVALDAEAHAARESLGALGRATHDAWDALRDDASAAWERLESAVKKALSDVERVRSETEERPAEPDREKA